MRTTNLLITGLLLTAGLALPASAGTTKTNEVRTTISKAELSTPQGVQKVYKDLRKTAAESCQANDQQTLANRIMSRKCEARLMNEFIDNVAHAELTAYHHMQSRN